MKAILEKKPAEISLQVYARISGLFSDGLYKRTNKENSG